MAAITSIGTRAVIENLSGFNSGMQVMRRQMGITGRNAHALTRQFNTSMTATADSARKNTASVRTHFANLTKAIYGFGPAISRMGQLIRGIGNELLILGFQFTFLGSGIIAGTLSAAAKFEEAMIKMSTLAEVPVDDLRGLSEEILRIAPALGQLPSELAEGFFFIMSQGARTTADGLEILNAVAKASSLGLGEMADVSKLVIAILEAYSSTGITATEVTDKLIAAVRVSAADADEFAGSLGRVLGVSDLLGASLDDLLAFVSTVTQVGLSADEAVTSLRATMTNLLKPSEQAKKILAEFGTNAEFVRDSISEQGLLPTLVNLRELFGDNTEALARVISNTRGLAGTLIVTGPLLDNLIEAFNNISDSAGTTEDAFELFSTTTTFHLNKLKSTLQVLGITVGSALLPGLNALLDVLSGIAASIAEFAKQEPVLTQVIGAAIALFTALGPILIIVGLLISALGTFITALGGLVTAFLSLTTPIGFVVGGLIALFAALGAAKINKFAREIKSIADSSQQTARGVSNAVRHMKSDIGSLSQSLGDTSDGWAAGLRNVENSTRGTAEDVDNEFEKMAIAAFDWGANIVLALASGIATATIEVVKALIKLGKVIAKWLKGASPPKLLPDLELWGANIVNSLLEGFTLADFSIFDDLSGILERLFRSLSSGDDIGLVPMIMQMRDAVAQLVSYISSGVELTDEVLQNTLGTFGDLTDEIFGYARALAAAAIASEELSAAQENLKALQEELADIQEKYANQLDPLNDKLEAIQNQRDKYVQQQRIAELQAILADPFASGAAKQFALLELEEIRIRNQVEQIENKRDEEIDSIQEAIDAAEEQVEVAQENLRLAQEQVDLIERQIEAQIINNNLIREQTDLLDRLAKAMEDIGEAADGIGGALGGGAGGLFGTEGGLGTALTEAFDSLFGPDGPLAKRVSTFVTDISALFTPLTEEGGLLDQLETQWGETFGLIGDKIESVDWETFGTWVVRLAGALLVINTAKSVISIFTALKNFLVAIATLPLLVSTFSDIVAVFSVFGTVLGEIALVAGAAASVLLIIKDIFSILYAPAPGGGGVVQGVEDLDRVNQILTDMRNADVQGLEETREFLEGLSEIDLRMLEEHLSGTNSELSILAGELADEKMRVGQQEILRFLGGGPGDTRSLSTAALTGANAIEGFRIDAVQDLKDFNELGSEEIQRFYDTTVGNSIIPDFKNDSLVIFGEWKDALIGGESSIFPATVSGILGNIKKVMDPEVEGSIPHMIGSILAWLQDPGILDMLKVAAGNLAQGIWNAITDLLSGLPAWLAALITNMVNAANNAGDSSSPSKKMYGVGKNLAMGLALGLDTMGDMDKKFAGMIGQGIASVSYGQVNAPPSVYNRTVNMNGFNINNGMDAARMKIMIEQAMRDAI